MHLVAAVKADWTTSITAFLAHLGHERRLSSHTLAAYRHDLDLLAAATQAGTIMVSTTDLRRELARAHAGGLHGRSLARRLAAWRSFYRWLQHEGLHSSNPSVGLRPPRSARRLPGVLGVEAASFLVQAGPAPDNVLQATDKGGIDAVLVAQDDAMFELMYSSGLRLSEITGLDLPRLDLTQGLVTVQGKGNRTRIVPVGAPACTALRLWLDVRAQLIPANDLPAVFLGRRGRRISPRVVQQRLADRAAALGIPQRVHPHMLRHSCASHVLQSSADLRAVQELLGHASIASTQIYTHLDFQHLATAYDAAHPRARKRAKGES